MPLEAEARLHLHVASPLVHAQLGVRLAPRVPVLAPPAAGHGLALDAGVAGALGPGRPARPRHGRGGGLAAWAGGGGGGAEGGCAPVYLLQGQGQFNERKSSKEIIKMYAITSIEVKIVLRVLEG